MIDYILMAIMMISATNVDQNQSEMAGAVARYLERVIDELSVRAEEENVFRLEISVSQLVIM